MSTPENNDSISAPETGDGSAPRVAGTVSPEFQDILDGLKNARANWQPPVVKAGEVPEPRIVTPRTIHVPPRIVESRIVPPGEPNQ